MFDCHIHTNFSPDGRMTPEEACRKAFEAGLDGIAITDHLDIDFPDETFYMDVDEYTKAMKLLKNNINMPVKVLIGIEMGIQPHIIDSALEVVRKNDFDYVLASAHVMDRNDPYRPGFYEGKTKKEAYERYLKEMIFMVRNFPDFDNVAHFEYITRNAGYDDRTLRYKEHHELFDELLKAIIERGKGFEINTGSFRYKPGKNDCEYDIEVLKRYKEIGGEIVSLGSDAHNTAHIGYKFNLFREILKEAGFNTAVYFEGRKPVFYRL